MLNDNEIIDFITKNDMLSFEMDGESFYDYYNIIRLKNNEMSELIRFAKVNDLKVIMYCYRYYDLSEYQIDEDMLSESEDKLHVAINKEVDKYRNCISKLDFSRPKELNIFCVLQGCAYAIRFTENWMEEQDVLTGEEQYDAIKELDSVLDIEHNIAMEHKEQRKEFQNHLKPIILADPKFYECTNKELRRYYACELRGREGKDKFATIQDAADFIESIWRDYKLNHGSK